MLKRCRPLLGTFVEITADREDAIEAAFDAVAQVHRLMSAHDPDSDLARINRFAHLRAVEVHEWTARVLDRSLYWARRSGGAFDPVRAGRAAFQRRSIPPHAGQLEAHPKEWTSLSLDGRFARLSLPACVDLGGIAKGFAVDQAVDELQRLGCDRGLVNAGGDLRGFGPTKWPVTIVHPRTREAVIELVIGDQALATSGGLVGDDGRLNFEHLGGRSARWSSVSVVARTACDADALTKLAWRGSDDTPQLLAEAGAKALGILHNGSVEELSEPAAAVA